MRHCDSADPRLAADDAAARAVLDADSNAAAVGVTEGDINELMANVCFTIGCRRRPRIQMGAVANICCEPCLDNDGHSHSRECHSFAMCGRC